MNRYLSVALALAVVAPITDAQPRKTASDPTAVVARINGETITKGRIDELWNRVPEHLQKQYALSGGRPVFLNNYVRKRVLLQEAFRTGFAKDEASIVDPAAESALFDRYIREVIATSVVTEEVVRAHYQENRGQFAYPDQVQLRQIFAGTTEQTPAQAQAKLAAVVAELREYGSRTAGNPNAKELLRDQFAAAAREHSEHDSGAAGGLLGWVGLGKMDAASGEVAFGMEPGTMSDIVKVEGGLVLLFVEAKREAGIEAFETVAPEVREFLLLQNLQKVMDAVNTRTSELLSSADMKLYPENL